MLLGKVIVTYLSEKVKYIKLFPIVITKYIGRKNNFW